MKQVFGLLLVITAFSLSFDGCAKKQFRVKKRATPAPTATPVEIPPTLAEILDKKDTNTDSPLKNADFLNLTYPLPRGWQDHDSKEITLVNGNRRMTEEKIGMSYLTTKYGDATGDGLDEAFVILRVRTGGSATPHIVYIFEPGDEGPEIIWYFRTGDRADGGLKRIYADDGDLIVELFGQDRYIFNQMETLNIVGDNPQLCCPDSFTRNRYKRVSNGFELKDKRLTYSLKDPTLPPRENLGETALKENSGKD